MSAIIADKTIWVTGASSGIGKAVVEELAKQTNFIIVSARSEEKLEQLKNKYPKKVTSLPYDILDKQANEDINQKLANITDHIDIVIMCSGTCEYDDGPYFEASVYQKVMDTNFMGAVNTLRACLPFVKNSNKNQNMGPRIVAVGSLSSLAAFPRAEAYGASKAALDYLMDSASIDLAKEGISVSVVRPGFVDTPLTKNNDFPMPWLMTPEQAAKHIVKGIAKGKRYIHFPWMLSVILKIGKLFPAFWVSVIGPKLIKKEETL